VNESNNSMLQKIMTPAAPQEEFDSGSLKRRDPKKMFTDSSFYNSKYHPTIADQVEMAHRLSSAMFNEQNKGTKGAKMYLSRMEHSGGFGEDIPKHDNIPNMKLVMNPEGKVHVWDDLPADQRPDLGQLAVHAAPSLKDVIPETADPVAESLNAGVGRGEKSFYRPSSFVSAYRQVFNQNRRVFGSRLIPKSSKDSKQHDPITPSLTQTKDSKVSMKSEPVSAKTSAMAPSPKPAPKVVPKPVESAPSVEKRTVNLKRQSSFPDSPRNSLEQQRKAKYFVEPEPSINSIKPSDTLKTPYLLPTSHSYNQGNFFPQITSTSMVSKTKAIFEDGRDNFIPLGKSKTFSSFPLTPAEESSSSTSPSTPSVPKRKSSKSVLASYKSLNTMNNCGMESATSSPFIERRIPMRDFF